MTERETTTAKASWTQRRAVLKKLWAWIVLGLAVLFFAIHFVPKFYFAGMYTETIVLPIFYHDVVELHHSPANWDWGGFSALFPDDAAYFALNFLFRDGQTSLELLMICFFVAWLVGSVTLGLVLGHTHHLALCSLLFLLWVGLMCDFGLPPDWSLLLRNSLFFPIYHSGTGILCLFCLGLLLSQISRPRAAAFWWLFVLTFLGGISDFLFLVVFIAPALTTVMARAAAFPREWKKLLPLGLNLAVAGVAAYFLAAHCFPPTMSTDYYLNVSLERAQASLSTLADQLTQSTHHFFAFAFALDVVTILGGIAGTLYLLFSSRKNLVPTVLFCLMVFCATAILCNWIAVIGTGGYKDMPSNRYVTVAMILPMLLLVLGLHAIIQWRPWLEKLFAVAISTFAVCVAFIPQDPSINYHNTEADIPFLKSVMSQNHIHDCLANYWSANITTFLSHGEVSPRSLTSDGRIYYWFNSLEWFGKGHPYQEWPHFRMIYEPDHSYSDRFGPPDQVVYSPGGSEVWLYSDARCIRYSEYFDLLSNQLRDDGRTMEIDPSILPGVVGKVQNHSRIVVDGQDSEGWIEFGPYLELEPGRFRATFHYTYLVPPAKDRLPTYDLCVHTNDHEASLDSTTLPCPNTDPQTFSDEFTVTDHKQQYEMRLYYHGSGTLRVDSLEVTYLGPGK